MEFRIVISPKGDFMRFEDAVIVAQAVPKADGRTKLGKRQLILEDCACEAMIALADEVTTGLRFGEDVTTISGVIEGHLDNETLDGSISITLDVQA